MAQVTIVGYRLTEQTFRNGKHNNVLSLVAKRSDDTEYVFKRIVFNVPNWQIRYYFDTFKCIGK